MSRRRKRAPGRRTQTDSQTKSTVGEQVSAAEDLWQAAKSRVVNSPAGEPIRIIADEDWEQLVGHTVAKPYKSKLNLLRSLWHEGGVADPDGRATAVLHARALQYGYAGRPVAITGLFKDPLNTATVERRINGKRCYSIKLVALPEHWLERMEQLDLADPDIHVESFGEPVPVDSETFLPLHAVPEPSQADRDAAALMESVLLPPEMRAPEPEPEPALEPSTLELAPAVAMAMLTQVVEIIAAGGTPEAAQQRITMLQADLADSADKLARRLSENDSLRRQMRLLIDEVGALKHERDGLRRELRITQHNLEKATSADTERYVRERVQQELAKIMSVKPGTQKGSDDA